MFFGLEYATVIWDLTAFLDQLFLLYSMWMKNLLGLDDISFGRLANIAERLG